jgi:hypothetical protein
VCGVGSYGEERSGEVVSGDGEGAGVEEDVGEV